MKKIICERCGATENKDRDGEKNKIGAIIRTHYVCNNCFEEIRKDNEKLTAKGKNITKSLITEDEKEEMKRTREKLKRRF